MSIESSPHQGISRRSFLKTSAVAGAGVAALSGGSLAGCASEQETASSTGEEVFHCVCRPNCFAFCHLDVHVRDGRVVKTTRGKYNESVYTRICQRGLSHVQRIYDPQRVLHPLHRVEGTARGEGVWERLTWEEAIKNIADEIKEVQDTYGNSSVAFYSISGNKAACLDQSYNRFRALIGGSSVSMAVDMASFYGFTRHAGYAISGKGNNFWEANEPTDVMNAKSIVVWGSNVTDAQVHNWHLIKEAMYAGTRLVVIDPIFTQIASKAEKWISVRPASDAALKYGIMYQVLQDNAQDEAFLRDHTCSPFLVREDTKRFLRQSDVEDGGSATTYMVLSEGELVPLTEGVIPQIEGEYDFEGIRCRTAFELLKEEICKYPPEEVKRLTDVNEEDLRFLVDVCENTPVYHYEGYGPQAYANGVHSCAAGLTMCALLGNVGYSGASYGAFWGQFTGLNSAYGAPVANSAPTVNTVDLPNIIKAGEWNGSPFAIKMMWIYCANPVSTCCDTNVWTSTIIPSLDCLIVADSAMTDTACYADYVLPIAQFFEVEEVAYAGQTTSLHYNEQAIEPVGESKTDRQILTLLAQELGFGDYFTDTVPEVLQILLNTEANASWGISYESLKEKGQIRFEPGDATSDPHIAWKDGIFNSPSKRYEYWLENPAVRAATTRKPTAEETERERLPRFVEPLEAWPTNKKYERYPLVCMSERPRYRVHSQWFSTPLLRELDPEPVVYINPVDATSRGVEDNSYAECYNDRGHCVALAVYSEGVRPGTLRYPKSWQMSQHKAGCWSELSSTEYDTYGVNYNFMDVLCEIRPWKED